jgi:hypothetical protein
MFNLIEQVREWQKIQVQAYWNYFKPKVELKPDTKCYYCQSPILPGERHPSCDSQIKIDMQYQCIVCLNDERVGDHSKCREEISRVRSFLGIN